MIGANYAHNRALLTNTPTQTKSLLHSIKQAVGGIGFYMNANKTEYVCFKQKEAISTLSGKPQK